MQFVAIIIVSGPSMFLSSLLFCLFEQATKTEIKAYVLSFLTAVILVLIVLIDGSLSLYMQLSGSLVCVVAIILLLIIGREDLKNIYA